MTEYISISQHPGTQGKYFYTEFFKRYNIDAVYVPCSSTAISLADDVRLAIKRGVSGISVSMPFKQQIIRVLQQESLLHELDSSVTDYGSCNTIKVGNSGLHGFNTDLAGVKYTVGQIDDGSSICILGNGAMGKMFSKYISMNKYCYTTVFSRSLGNWQHRHVDADVIINCTAMGTASTQSPLEYVSSKTVLVIDLAIKSGQLYEQCSDKKITYLSGQDFYKYQFIEQFMHYCGINIGLDDYEQIKLTKHS